MQNLTLNQHKIYTYRKYFSGVSVRVSLRTKDRSLANRICYRVNEVQSICPYLSVTELRKLVDVTVTEFHKKAVKEKRLALLDLLKADNPDSEHYSGYSLSELVTMYVAEKKRTNCWSAHSNDLYNRMLELLLSILGDLPVQAIGNTEAQKTKSYLQKLPSNLKKYKAYRGKTVHELVRLKIPDDMLLSIKTINMRLSCYSDLFNWAVKNGYVSGNPFRGIQLKDTRDAKQLRLPFTDNDLQQIFSCTAIVRPKLPHHFWLPVLGLYTGARINELCQLYVEDIKVSEDIHYISINDSRPDQRLKTSSSRRNIPIHSDVINMGFLSYIDGLKNRGVKRLFPELKFNNGKYSHEASKWFGRVKSKALSDADKKSFHSFRHTFVEHLHNKLKLTGNPIVKALVGHQDKEVTSGVYGADFSIIQLSEVIEKSRYRHILNKTS